MDFSKSTRRTFAIVLMILFAGLTVFVCFNPVNSFDVASTKYLQAQSWLKPLESTNALAKMPAFRLIYVVLALAFVLAKRYMLSLLVAGSLASEVLTAAIKALIGRARPTSDIATLLDHSPGYSYVSGHTLEYTLLFGFLGALVLAVAKSGVVRYLFAGLFFSLPFVIGMGRVYAGAHWLTDVVGSFLLGGALVLAVLGMRDDILLARKPSIQRIASDRA